MRAAVTGEVDHLALMDRPFEAVGEDELRRERRVCAEAGERREQIRLRASLGGHARGAALQPLAHAGSRVARADDPDADLVRRQRAARVEWAVTGQPEADVDV